MLTYTNRHGDIFTFTKQEDGNVLWEGPFEYIRIGYPNNYSEAYKKCALDGHAITMEHFKEEVHKSIYDKDGNYVKGSMIQEKYAKLVTSDTNTIDMIDPSGGPYLSVGMDLVKLFNNWEYFSYDAKNLIIDKFEPVEKGYIIHIR